MTTLLYPAMMVASFAPLLLGADLAVRGASVLASRLGIAPIIVGMTVVAFGTSLPELVVNISAALSDQPAVALGNVLGSNIFNIGATIGILAIIRSLPIKRSTTWAEIPIAILAAVVMAVVAPDTVTRSEGILLLSLFLLFMVYIAAMVKRTNGIAQVHDEASPRLERRPIIAGGAVVIGLGLLVLGGEGVVRGAVGTARFLGMPEYVIAATIVAVGTSLPELVTSIAAVRRGEIDLAVGNVVGSNIFNVFLVVGATASIRPIETTARPLDHGVHVLSTLLIFLFVFTGKGRKIERWEGILLLLLYLGYAVTILRYG